MSIAKINRLREKAFGLQAEGKLKEAYAAFSELMRLVPDEIESARRTADLCRNLGFLDEAATYYEMVAEHYVADGLFLKAMSACISPSKAKSTFRFSRILTAS